MNFSNKHHDIVDQNDENVKKSQKHDANVQKNSTLYFQIGLIITLLFTYGIFEMQFQKKTIVIPETIPLDEDAFIVEVVPFTEPLEDVKKKFETPTKRQIVQPVIIKNGISKSPQKTTIVTTPNTTPKLKAPNVNTSVAPKNFNQVEQVPIYPGCEKYISRQEQMSCMIFKISKLINRKFDADLMSKVGITGVRKVYVQFTIDRFGNVTQIKARGPHEVLEKEARKAVSQIPKMQPGKQNNKAVPVIYTLPIVVKINY